MKVMNGLDLQSQKITALGDPTSGTDAANKQYVDNFVRGLQWKQPVRLASTANVNIANPGFSSLDGVTLVAGNRILLKDQTTASQNGIYIWTASGSALTRATDCDTGTELAPGTAVTVTEGSVSNADKIFTVTTETSNAIIIGTDPIQWAVVGGGGVTYSALTNGGLALNGSNAFSILLPASSGLTTGATGLTLLLKSSNSGLTYDSSGLGIDTTKVARKFSMDVPAGSAGTSLTINHQLNTQDVVVSVKEIATQAGVLVDWVATDVNNVTLTFAAAVNAAPGAGSFRVTVVG